MKLLAAARRIEAGRAQLVGEVARGDGSRCEVTFSYDAADAPLVSDAADALVPALLLPAMAAGETLELGPPVSPRLLESLPRLQTIFSGWFPGYRVIEVVARPTGATRGRIDSRAEATRDGIDAGPARGVGAFFSGGVDSFYTLLKSVRGLPREGPPISHLLFFHGLETTLDARRGGDAAEARARRVARDAGVACVVGETNLRTCFPLVWGQYCGAGLAAAGHSLAGGLSHVLVPSTDAYADAVPWGSHPLVDPLWSTERTAIVSDGGEVARSEKLVRLVANDPLAQKHLRVCVHNDGGDFNCGRCYKCVRTMVVLHGLGLEERFDTLPRELPPDLDRILAADYELYLTQGLAVLERTGRAPALEARLRRVLRARRRRDGLRTLLENTAPAWLVERIRALRAGRG